MNKNLLKFNLFILICLLSLSIASYGAKDYSKKTVTIAPFLNIPSHEGTTCFSLSFSDSLIKNLQSKIKNTLLKQTFSMVIIGEYEQIPQLTNHIGFNNTTAFKIQLPEKNTQLSFKTGTPDYVLFLQDLQFEKTSDNDTLTYGSIKIALWNNMRKKPAIISLLSFMINKDRIRNEEFTDTIASLIEEKMKTAKFKNDNFSGSPKFECIEASLAGNYNFHLISKDNNSNYGQNTERQSVHHYFDNELSFSPSLLFLFNKSGITFGIGGEYQYESLDKGSSEYYIFTLDEYTPDVQKLKIKTYSLVLLLQFTHDFFGDAGIFYKAKISKRKYENELLFNNIFYDGDIYNDVPFEINIDDATALSFSFGFKKRFPKKKFGIIGECGFEYCKTSMLSIEDQSGYQLTIPNDYGELNDSRLTFRAGIFYDITFK